MRHTMLSVFDWKLAVRQTWLVGKGVLAALASIAYLAVILTIIMLGVIWLLEFLGI